MRWERRLLALTNPESVENFSRPSILDRTVSSSLMVLRDVARCEVFLSLSGWAGFAVFREAVVPGGGKERVWGICRGLFCAFLYLYFVFLNFVLFYSVFCRFSCRVEWLFPGGPCACRNTDLCRVLQEKQLTCGHFTAPVFKKQLIYSFLRVLCLG